LAADVDKLIIIGEVKIIHMNSSVDMSDVFEEKKKFYSKNAVALSTFFLSPLLGCILFSYNLKEVGRGKLAPVFIILSIAWVIVIRKLSGIITSIPLLQLFIANFLASLLLTFVIWNRFLGDDIEYEARPAWKPVSIFIGICFLLMAFQYFGAGRR
jgi:hypothetical protein